MTAAELEVIAEGLFKGAKTLIARGVERITAQFGERFEALEQRVAAIPHIKGEPGDKGERGEKGEQGPAGERGEPGEVGPPGARGERGEVGPTGPVGERGLDGAIGPRGERGERGHDAIGLVGPPGERGERGLSAFEVAKAGGYVGSEVEWLLSLRGKDGASGLNGVAGQNGQDGRDGRDGERGERGRDALELEILDGIDPGRSYARGTAAVFNGGTFWAMRATDPIMGDNYREAGWLCMFRGIAAVGESIEDGGRVIVRTTRYSDGFSHVERLQTTAMIHRGLFQSGQQYDAGDVVTYGGSMFVAQKQTTQPPGDGDTSVWRMAVKRGKDGRDAA